MLSVFDLGFTLAARALGVLIELNPVADWLMLRHGDLAVIAYKMVLMGLGTVILWACHRNKSSEVAAWFLVVIYALLAVRWYSYYHREDTSDAVIEIVPVIAASRSTAPATPVAHPPHLQTRTDGSRSESDDAELRLARARRQ